MNRWVHKGDGVYYCPEHDVSIRRTDAGEWQLHLSTLNPPWRMLQIPQSVLRSGRAGVQAFLLAILDKYEAEKVQSHAD